MSREKEGKKRRVKIRNRKKGCIERERKGIEDGREEWGETEREKK